MKIDILCGSGSTNSVHYSDIFGKNGRIGVGGAELGLLTMCEGWHKKGHHVTLYNNPRHNDGLFEQRAVASFDKNENRDVLIAFREPTSKIYKSKGMKVFWSCDQYTIGDFRHFSQFVDKVVTISPFHSSYFSNRYGIGTSISIDLPVRTWEYKKVLPKEKNRLIFTSVPDRGLEFLAHMWPKLAYRLPDISLVITSDYRLWGSFSPNNDGYVRRFLHTGNVQFLGAVPRERLVEEQMKAQVHLYPCSYEELFCIACAESQVAGVLPITTAVGALSTTNSGIIINGKPSEQNTQEEMINKTVEYLSKDGLPEIQKSLRENAIERFGIENIMKQWDEKVFNA